jgi:hypothetical protein
LVRWNNINLSTYFVANRSAITGIKETATEEILALPAHLHMNKSNLSAVDITGKNKIKAVKLKSQVLLEKRSWSVQICFQLKRGKLQMRLSHRG